MHDMQTLLAIWLVIVIGLVAWSLRGGRHV